MKSLILGVLMSLTATALAESSIDRTPVVATLEGGRMGISMIALLADGRLQIVSRDKTVQTEELPKLVKEELVKRAIELSETKIRHIRRDSFCKLAVRPMSVWSDLSVSKFNYDSGKFTSELRPTLSRRGCYVKDEFYPEDANDREQAVALREQLVILTLSYIK